MKRGFDELYASDEGREWLAANGVFLNKDAFLRQLSPPASLRLAEFLGGDGVPVICGGQQLYFDAGAALVTKMRCLGAFGEQGAASAFLWLDTDLASSDPLMSRLDLWPPPGRRRGPLRLASPKTLDREQRFVVRDPDLSLRALERLRQILGEADAPPGTRERLEELESVWSESNGETLAAQALGTMSLLFRSVIPRPPTLLLSAVIEPLALGERMGLLFDRREAIAEAMTVCLARLDEDGVDGKLKPPPPEWSPLFVSCPVCQRRIRAHVRDGAPETICRGCGWQRTWDDRTTLLQETTWSPDVTLPLLLNDRVSGFVGGRSSALYGIVLAAAAREALGERAAPWFVPPPAPAGVEVSLLRDFLLPPGRTGGTDQ